MQVPGMNDFYSVHNADPDKDGLIECALIPFPELVLYPNMVTPLFIGRERSVAALLAAQAHNETVIGVAQLAAAQTGADQDLFSIGAMAMGRPMRMPDGSTSVLVQGRRRVEIVKVIRRCHISASKARPLTEPTERGHLKLMRCAAQC
ncbi:MAG: LON peptidase substrate-binding domain-containing protein [Anaerolineae bacterium]